MCEWFGLQVCTGLYTLMLPCTAWFTFSLRRECEGYIRLVCNILDLFLSCLEALGNMSVNCTRVKGHKCLTSLFKLRSILFRSSCTRVWMSAFMSILSRSHLANSLDKCLWRECKPSITVMVYQSRPVCDSSKWQCYVTYLYQPFLMVASSAYTWKFELHYMEMMLNGDFAPGKLQLFLDTSICIRAARLES